MLFEVLFIIIFNLLFPVYIPSEIALDILRVLIEVNATLIGFMAIVTVFLLEYERKLRTKFEKFFFLTVWAIVLFLFSIISCFYSMAHIIPNQLVAQSYIGFPLFVMLFGAWLMLRAITS